MQIKIRSIAALVLSIVTVTAWLSAETNVSGRWEATVKGPAAHGDMAATLVLAQRDDKVTGTFSVHGTEHKLAGTLKDNALELATTDTPADKSLTFSAKLQSDGTLSGFLSGPMGDMKWTASRAKDK